MRMEIRDCLSSVAKRLRERGIPMAKGLLLAFWEFSKYVLLTAIITLLITKFVIINAFIPSESMEPTLSVGAYSLCLRASYWFMEPRRGDVVVFNWKENEQQIQMVKRIVGMPNDLIEINEGITFINGNRLEEPYLKEAAEKLDFGPYRVPENSYFCMGDNRNNSVDSRYWENPFVAREDILAQSVWTFSMPYNSHIVS